MTKKQHYVPRFYLERFADGQGSVYVYDFKQNKFYKSKPEGICCQNCLYEVEWTGSERVYGKYMSPNHLENIFSRYENEFSSFLRKMDRLCHPGQNPNALICSTEDKNTLLRLVVNFFIRTPQMMEALSVNEIPKGLEEVEGIGALHEALDLMGMGGWESFVKMAVEKAYLTEEYGEGPVFDLLNSIRNLNFTFYRAQEGCFLTSDQPVSIGIDKHIPMGDKQCLYFALSPKVVVLFGDYEESKNKRNRMVIISNARVEDFNMVMVKKIKELPGKIIANSEESVMRYVNQI